MPSRRLPTVRLSARLCPKDTLVATFNDLASVERLLSEHSVAAVILEPVVGNSGFIEPTEGFLKGLRELTTKHGALLVFDEASAGASVGESVVARVRASVERGKVFDASVQLLRPMPLQRARRYNQCLYRSHCASGAPVLSVVGCHDLLPCVAGVLFWRAFLPVIRR